MMNSDTVKAHQVGALAALRFALKTVRENWHDRYKTQTLLEACIGYAEQVLGGAEPLPSQVSAEIDEVAA